MVSMLFCYVVSPCEGHLQQVFHIFAYLKRHKQSQMVFGDTEPVFHESIFKVCNWSEFYLDAKELTPPTALQVHGCGVITLCFIDSDHAGCKVMRCLHTGVILFANKVPILWLSKHQNTVETSTLGQSFAQ